ncbi:hypothetical protein [Allorhizocola rhizosphaerae]|uniref:hypothetical protein n=1 Tax=Allorhizocola rhizosphaerae TaxID=1872709 RepID=UPI0013C2E378|nr:hypothetical protein [Allorhizocola rhizosphaerae]
MIGKTFRTLVVVGLLSACGTPAAPAAPQSAPPVPVLKVGEAFTADLLGNGQATIAVSNVELSGRSIPGDAPVTGELVHLVVTVKILLDRAGRPIAGGPDNFRFRDAAATVHTARTNNAVFPPELGRVDLVAPGQQSEGRVYFAVPRDAVGGGHIQLTTGRIVHALWRV